MEFFLNTSDTPIKEEHNDINKPAINALSINEYENILKISLIIVHSPYKFIDRTKEDIIFSQ